MNAFPKGALAAFFLSSLLLFLPPAVQGQETRIRIAVLDLLTSDSISPAEAAEINLLFRNAVSETAVFEVVERSMLDRMMEEQRMQLSGAIDESELISFGRILAVRQLLIGSAGRLFGRIVMTAQLLNAETGKIVFAQTLVTDEEDFYDDIRRFALEIASKAIDATVTITPEMIQDEIKKKRFIQAKRYLDVYITEHGITPETRNLRDQIVPSLAAIYGKEADRLRREHQFEEALVYAQKALVLAIDERYIELRDRIIREEESYLEDLRIREEKRRQQTLRREAQYERMVKEGQSSLVAAYLSKLSVLGIHLGVSNAWEIGSDFALPDDFGRWGAELILAGDPVNYETPREEERGTKSRNSLAYMGFSLSAEPDGGGGNLLEGKAYLSPYTAIGLKLANLVFLFGVVGGAYVRFSSGLSDGYDWGLLAGLSASAELKVSGTAGLYAMARGEYRYCPDDPSVSKPAVCLSAGIVF